MNLAKNPGRYLILAHYTVDSYKALLCRHGLPVSPGLLDHRCCRQRTDRSQSPQEQQHHPTGAADPDSHQGKKGLIGFGKPGWQRKLERAINDWWFYKTLPAKIDKAEADWHATQPEMTPPPVVIEHPVDESQQTGDSRLLGGPISIHAPWRRD